MMHLLPGFSTIINLISIKGLHNEGPALRELVVSKRTEKHVDVLLRWLIDESPFNRLLANSRKLLYCFAWLEVIAKHHQTASDSLQKRL